jgi:hypothetical protein
VNPVGLGKHRSGMPVRRPSGFGRPANCYSSAVSDEDGSAIDDQGLPRAESFLHQEQIGLGYVMRFADSAHRQTVAHAFIQVLPLCYSHALPEVRPNDSRRHGVHAYRRQFKGKCACQSLDGAANTGGNNPSLSIKMRRPDCTRSSDSLSLIQESTMKLPDFLTA